MFDHFYSGIHSPTQISSQQENAESNVISGFQSLEIRISSKVNEREFHMKTTQEIPRQTEFNADKQKKPLLCRLTIYSDNYVRLMSVKSDGNSFCDFYSLFLSKGLMSALFELLGN